MDINELNELIGKACSRAMKEGVQEGKMDMLQIIGLLDRHKTMVMNLSLAMESAAVRRAQSGLIKPNGAPVA